MHSIRPTNKPDPFYSNNDDQQHKKILIVDDNVSNRTVLRGTLEPLGFVYNEVGDGCEVLPACERLQPDAILMDLCMPEVDGLTATKQLKSHKQFCDTPIIAITTSTAELQKLKKQHLNHDFSSYIIKPYNMSGLLETIARVVSYG